MVEASIKELKCNCAVFTFRFLQHTRPCGGSCVASKDCADGANDSGCRCSYLSCTITVSSWTELLYPEENPDKVLLKMSFKYLFWIQETPCGGRCMTGEQCSLWSGGDPSCVCTWWFECEYANVLKNPGYKPWVSISIVVKNIWILCYCILVLKSKQILFGRFLKIAAIARAKKNGLL
jgi:hypothetical protein